MTTSQDCIQALQNTMATAYAPYSNYPVAAMVITPDGHSYLGCNVENASYPEGNCAETSAIAAMVAAGHRQIAAIYIMSQDEQGASPCGGCRQRIREFALHKEPANTQVYLCSPNRIVHQMSLQDLLPHAFGPGLETSINKE